METAASLTRFAGVFPIKPTSMDSVVGITRWDVSYVPRSLTGGARRRPMPSPIAPRDLHVRLGAVGPQREADCSQRRNARSSPSCSASTTASSSSTHRPSISLGSVQVDQINVLILAPFKLGQLRDHARMQRSVPPSRKPQLPSFPDFSKLTSG